MEVPPDLQKNNMYSGLILWIYESTQVAGSPLGIGFFKSIMNTSKYIHFIMETRPSNSELPNPRTKLNKGNIEADG